MSLYSGMPLSVITRSTILIWAKVNVRQDSRWVRYTLCRTTTLKKKIAMLGSQQNWKWGTEISHIYILPPNMHSPPPIINICGRIVNLPQRMDLHWHHFIQSPSFLYLRVHSRCCVFYGFGKMHNDIYSSLVHYI